MSELARRILTKSLGAMRRECAHCTSCRRTPVPGEYVHRLESRGVVCSLCLADLPADQREAATAERVHASHRHVAAAPRAA